LYARSKRYDKKVKNNIIFAGKSEHILHLESLWSETLDGLLEPVVEPGWKDDDHGDVVALVGQLHHVGLQLLARVVVEAALLLHELHQPDLKGKSIEQFKVLIFKLMYVACRRAQNYRHIQKNQCAEPDPNPDS
jgi:hypothetical protein